MPPLRHRLSDFYKWKLKFGGLEVSKARRLRSLEEENARLKKLLADAMLVNAALKDLASKCMTRPAHAMDRWVVTVPVCTNGSGLSRVDRCCG